MTGYEETLLTRAEVLDDTSDLVQAITDVLAGAQASGADPAAVTSLQAAARALDPGADTGYDAGSKHDRQHGAGYRSDGEFLEAVSGAEDDARDRLREAEQLQEAVITAMDATQAALDAAYAMPVKDECDGCHGAKEAAIQAALSQIRLCETAAGILDPLAGRLSGALGRLRQVPEDLGEAYQLVYAFIHKGGKLPVYARWIEGQGKRVLPAGILWTSASRASSAYVLGGVALVMAPGPGKMRPFARSAVRDHEPLRVAILHLSSFFQDRSFMSFCR
jgi:hypothetical protein